MMKTSLIFFFFFTAHFFAFSQSSDSLDLKDTTIIPVKDSSALIIKSDSLKKDIKTAVKDSVRKAARAPKRDSSGKKIHSPQQATLRSAIIPGWGQIYNRKYWKVPLVYGAIGFPVYLIFDNKRWYDRGRYALSIVAFERYDNADSVSRVHKDLMPYVRYKAQSSLVNFRNQSRKNMDYAILFSLLMWGLNIVDATVDGHLRGFDVSDELSLKIKPAIIPGSYTPGISLALNFK